MTNTIIRFRVTKQYVRINEEKEIRTTLMFFLFCCCEIVPFIHIHKVNDTNVCMVCVEKKNVSLEEVGIVT